MKKYNGHRSWNAWNVSLWISNHEPTYKLALECLRRADNKPGKAAQYFMECFGGRLTTQDGGVFNHLAVKLCMECFVETP